jgi:hypothetical protein
MEFLRMPLGLKTDRQRNSQNPKDIKNGQK